MNEELEKNVPMKHVIRMIILLILVLTSCSPDGAGYECSEGICISINYEEPVQAMVPAVFKISVITDKDVSDLGISLYNYTNVTIQDIKKPDTADLLYQSDELLTYIINTIEGEEYIFTGFVVLEKPSGLLGASGYELIAVASQYSGFRVTDSFHIYLNAEGNQLVESEAKLLMETEYPLPTPPPDMIVITRTPWPTIIWPTNTPLPTLTPTLPSYP